MNTKNIISLEKRQEIKSKFYQEREIFEADQKQQQQMEQMQPQMPMEQPPMMM